MIKLQHKISKLLIGAFCLSVYVSAQAANDVCSTASIINPNTIEGGMGGTGIPENGSMGGTGVTNDKGMGGTGATASGSLGGTGATANGSMGGTGVDNGFGGTGITADGGMGGTGVSAENGFGGTGLLPNDTQGGVAIIGVVTGFASICVNGEEVFYDKNTPVYDNGVAAKLSSLATGKMVMLKADKVGGQLRARSIGLFDAVAGPVGRVDAKQNQMQVMGQTVRLNQDMMQQVKGLSPNANVRVSGHRLDSGEIVATRVDISKVSKASTIGLVTGVTSDSVLVNGTRVHIENKNTLGKIKVGSEVRVNGQWDGSTIKAERVESQPIKNSVNRADNAIIEGFVKTGRDNTMRLGGTEIEASQGSTTYSSFEKSRGKVVKIEMRRDNKGRWVCDKVEERSGKLFERHGSINSDSSNSNSNSDDSLSSGGDDNGDMSSGSGNSGSGSDNSGSGSNSGSSSNPGSSSGSSSGHGSSSGASSGSGSGHGSSSSGGSGHGSSVSGSSGRGSTGRGSSSGSGGSDRSSSGKGK